MSENEPLFGESVEDHLRRLYSVLFKMELGSRCQQFTSEELLLEEERYVDEWLNVISEGKVPVWYRTDTDTGEISMVSMLTCDVLRAAWVWFGAVDSDEAAHLEIERCRIQGVVFSFETQADLLEWGRTNNFFDPVGSFLSKQYIRSLADL